MYHHEGEVALGFLDSEELRLLTCILDAPGVY